MSRKDLLKGLMAGPPAGTIPAQLRPARPAKGAIGAVSQSIAELRTRALTDVPADMIDDAGMKDRLGGPDDGLDKLAESLRDYGQQVPVLLRHSPNNEGRYEVVYGRRRVAALKRLGLPVRAMIRDLTDRDLVIAQGQENTARRDLSFIEKANFARQMADAGYERKIIGDALHLDKTVLSRMMSIVARVPLDLIEAIGPAPTAGRQRWMELADLLDTDRPLTAAALGETSDARFAAVLAAAKAANRAEPQKPGAPKPREVETTQGAPLARAKSERGGATTLSLDPTIDRGFADWLLDALPDLHRSWQERGE